MMEHWRSSGHTRESANNRQRKVLGSTSGNAQPHFQSVNQKPEEVKQEHHNGQTPAPSPVLRQSENDPSSYMGIESTYPLPSKIIGSNDQFTLNEQYLAARRARRLPAQKRLLADRPYLRDAKYINYRDRKRQDAGKDGKPVWPDYIEESFQNAIVQIPPMGRRKKTQYDPRVDDEDSGCEFWFESVADMVKAHRQLSAQGNSGALYNHIQWLGRTHQRHNLQRLNFDMWVALPENVTHALHSYTRIQTVHSVSPVMSLENYKHWRSMFPDLENIVSAWNEQECDIILLKSSHKLMSDFPPPSSKLGLVLELDFRHPTQERLQNLAGLRSWSCVNRMYENGKLFRSTEHKECKLSDVGCVKPFFEAEWWASQFTKLTDKRKHAVESDDPSVEPVVEEYSRSFFKGLTMMQEIYAAPEPSGLKRRICLLLWSFTQAHKGHVGITSWQKLVPPPSRNTTNSPQPGFDTTMLPPLNMDTVLEDDLDMDMVDDSFSFDIGHTATT
ncbi:hypothetical protein LTR66_017807, partial [Elasticomyces elasticus]